METLSERVSVRDRGEEREERGEGVRCKLNRREEEKKSREWEVSVMRTVVCTQSGSLRWKKETVERHRWQVFDLQRFAKCDM